MGFNSAFKGLIVSERVMEKMEDKHLCLLVE